MIKKILATISTFLLLSLSVSAMGMGGVGGGVSSPQYWKLTSGVLSPIDSSWSLNIAGGITFGASMMSGNLNMAGHNIDRVGIMSFDADNDTGFYSSADDILHFRANGQNYITYGVNTMTFLGASPTVSTVSNVTMAFVPNGSGKVRIGDAYTTPLSLGSDNDSLIVTKDLEVGDNIFTGGITMATNRGDVPWVDWSVTSASADGTAQSLPFLIDGNFMMSLYSESDGAGGIKNKEVRTISIRNYGDLISERITLPNDTTLPTTCAVGEIFLDTDSDDCADTGGGDGALCICKDTDTWVLLNNI
jgi:hypothetical protein